MPTAEEPGERFVVALQLPESMSVDASAAGALVAERRS